MKYKLSAVILIFFFLGYCYAYNCSLIPIPALRLLAQSTTDPCTICRQKLQKQAFTLLSKEIYPGKKITFENTCLLVKTKNCTANEFEAADGSAFSADNKDAMPLVVYKFYTQQHNIVGISPEDYTDDSVETLYNSLGRDARAEAELIVIPYKYSDNPAAIFIPKRNTLVIHCKIVRIQQR